MKKLSIAIIQMNAGSNIEQNLCKLGRLAAGVSKADVIALPEVFSMRGSNDDYLKTAQPLAGCVLEFVASLARNKKAWILAGSIIEKTNGRTYNTSVLVDRRGNIAVAYRKIHLFEAYLEDGQHIRESDAYSAGRKPVMADIEGWPVGLGICYDLRFPELSRCYAARGAAIIFFPSNFTQRTGRDHWEILLRARAIENQCFLVAPNQCGTNEAIGVTSHGHSMAIGPWGEVLCVAGNKDTVLRADLDPLLLRNVRQRIPALKHRVLKLK
ncbi:MAG: carbon-nitrogen hydrolase family protein [bacterium]